MSHDQPVVLLSIPDCEFVGDSVFDLYQLQPTDIELEATELYPLVSDEHYSMNTSAGTNTQMESDLNNGKTTVQLLLGGEKKVNEAF